MPEGHPVSFMEASTLTASNIEAAFLQILSRIDHKKAHKEQATGAASCSSGTLDMNASQTAERRAAARRGGGRRRK